MSSILIYAFIAILLPMAFTSKGVVKVVYGPEMRKEGSYTWNFALILCFTTTVLLRGIAYDTGTDWFEYTKYLQSLQIGHETLWGEHTEWLFRILCKWLINLEMPIFVFFTICMAFNYYSLIKFSKLFYYCVPFTLIMWYPFLFLMSCNVYRQYIAMALFLIAHYFLLRKDYWISLLLGLLSVLVHTASAIMTPLSVLFWILYKQELEINKYFIITSVVFSHIFGQSILSIIDQISPIMSALFSVGNGNVYEFTTKDIVESQYESNFSLVFLPIHIYWIIIADSIKKKYHYFKFIYIYSCAFFIIYPICHQEFLLRITLYLELFLPFMLGVLYFDLKHKRSNIQQWLFVLSLLPNWILFIKRLLQLFDNHPYKLIFIHNLI